jgi:hypothetical protein
MSLDVVQVSARTLDTENASRASAAQRRGRLLRHGATDLPFRKQRFRKQLTSSTAFAPNREIVRSTRIQEVQEVAHPSLQPVSNFRLQGSKVNTFYKVEQLWRGGELACPRPKAVLELLAYSYRLPRMTEEKDRSGGFFMSAAFKLTGLLVAGVLCLPIAGRADTQTVHRVHKVKKQLPPPLPSGPQGPVPQVPLDAIPAVAPEVTYQDGLLTIVAPNSTLADILRGVHKRTAADIDIPATASERVVTRLGPAPAREVMAELLNGSHFNYILLGSPEDANALVRVVLVAKTGPDTPNSPPVPAGVTAAQPVAASNVSPDAPDTDTAEDAAEDTPEPGTAEVEPASPDQPGVKTPQQMLQEMQQRQLQMQQQQQAGQQAAQPGVYPPAPGMPVPQRPPLNQPPQNQQ